MFEKILARLFIALIVIAGLTVAIIWYKAEGLGELLIKPSYNRSTSFSKTYPVGKEDIVFLGDSITAGSQWHEVFPNHSVKNRGIAGDTTKGVLKRIHLITKDQPRAIFLKIGTNDLTHGPRDRNISYQQYREIVKRIKQESPSSKLYLQSLLPRSASYQKEIEEFNRHINAIALEHSVDYVDLYAHFVAEDGSIINKFSNDELHLLGPGYLRWQALLEPYMTPLLPDHTFDPV